MASGTNIICEKMLISLWTWSVISLSV